jgi:hypothetical protein
MNWKEFIIDAKLMGLNIVTAKLCFLYLQKRQLHNTKEWMERFLRGSEWQVSDYEGRRVLQSLSDAYPKDLDEYFI